ncbi:hypothetical protein Bca4012_010539 [Brassica carinata]
MSLPLFFAGINPFRHRSSRLQSLFPVQHGVASKYCYKFYMMIAREHVESHNSLPVD